MSVNLEVTKILASGTWRRFMWFIVNDKSFCVLINDELYQKLKSLKVPTSQSLRKDRPRLQGSKK